MNTDKGTLAELDRTMKIGRSIWVRPIICKIPMPFRIRITKTS